MSGFSKSVQVLFVCEGKSSILGLFEVFGPVIFRLKPFKGLLEVFAKVVGANERNVQSAVHLVLRVENSRVLEKLDAELAVFEVFKSCSIDSRSTISFAGLRLDELSDLAWFLEDITGLQVVGDRRSASCRW